MHVLRIYLRSGPQIELLYRGKGDIRAASHALDEAGENARVSLADDFGKALTVHVADVCAWQPSDYGAELDGALAITRAKQEATEKFQREMQGKHSLLVPQAGQNAANGRVILG